MCQLRASAFPTLSFQLCYTSTIRGNNVALWGYIAVALLIYLPPCPTCLPMSLPDYPASSLGKNTDTRTSVVWTVLTGSQKKSQSLCKKSITKATYCAISSSQQYWNHPRDHNTLKSWRTTTFSLENRNCTLHLAFFAHLHTVWLAPSSVFHQTQEFSCFPSITLNWFECRGLSVHSHVRTWWLTLLFWQITQKRTSDKASFSLRSNFKRACGTNRNGELS